MGGRKATTPKPTPQMCGTLTWWECHLKLLYVNFLWIKIAGISNLTGSKVKQMWKIRNDR